MAAYTVRPLSEENRKLINGRISGVRLPKKDKEEQSETSSKCPAKLRYSLTESGLLLNEANEAFSPSRTAFVPADISCGSILEATMIPDETAELLMKGPNALREPAAL